MSPLPVNASHDAQDRLNSYNQLDYTYTAIDPHRI
jgi:hypothetical protein